MIYFTKRPRKIAKIPQIKEMLEDQTIEAYDELKKLDLCAQMVYIKEYELALEILKRVDFNQIVGNDVEYYYEVSLSCYASLNMVDEFVKVLDGYSSINQTVAVEILSEFFINNHHILVNKNILEEFALNHLEADDFRDYIIMISRYHNDDLEEIRKITKKNIGRVVELDIFHQKLYYELALIAFEEVEDTSSVEKLKEDLGSFDNNFLSKVNRLHVAKVPFNGLITFRKERAMRSKRGKKELFVWIILFILAAILFF